MFWLLLCCLEECVRYLFFRELCKIFAAHLHVDVSCIKQEDK
jgi:hypothetical protein